VLVRETNNLGEQGLVSAVNTVEVPDGKSSPVAACRSALGQE
jgi:hypothetical protein